MTPGSRARSLWLWLALCMVALGAAPARAQTQAHIDRADQIAKYGMRLAICKKLGLTLKQGAFDLITELALAEVQTWGLQKSVSDAVLSAAVRRHGQMMKMDFGTAVAEADTAAELRRISLLLEDLGSDCPKMLVDRIYSQVLSAPAGFNLRAAARELADSMLEDGGLASWQTPAVRARGDLMMLAGACRAQIGRVRSDAIVATHGRSDVERERRYYLKSFDNGLSDTELRFTKAQCERAIRVNEGKLAA